jgi:site-specific DNA-methyltransferase (adenine-specific)
MNHGAAKKYVTMSNEDIKQLPIKELADKNAVCFIWVTVPLLPEGLATLEAWGFKYKTMLTWRKVMSMGMGYWFRGQCEHLILGVRGKVKPFRKQTANFYQCKSGKHSQKPAYFRDLISQAVMASFETPNKLELFARTRDGLFPMDEYEGWDVFGNEVQNAIELPARGALKKIFCLTKL